MIPASGVAAALAKADADADASTLAEEETDAKEADLDDEVTADPDVAAGGWAPDPSGADPNPR